MPTKLLVVLASRFQFAGTEIDRNLLAKVFDPDILNL